MSSKTDGKKKQSKNAGLLNKYDEFIDDLMTNNAKENRAALHSELLNKIPLTDSYTNSISVAVGKQRSGKTRKIIKEIIKISKMHHETHMLLYVNKTGGETDKTFESFKNLIKCPIVYCSQEECEDKLAELIQYKNLYNKIMAAGTDIDEDPIEVETMMDVLEIEDYSRSYLHTLVLLDDIANSPLLRKPTTYLNSLMTQCAHINMSFFLAIQYWVGLPTAIKSQTSMIYLFGGFIKQQIKYMFTQVALEDPFDVVWEKYVKLKNRDFMTIDAIAGEYRVTISDYEEVKEKVDQKLRQKVNNQINGIEEEEEHEDLIQTAASENGIAPIVSLASVTNPVARDWLAPKTEPNTFSNFRQPNVEQTEPPRYRPRHKPRTEPVSIFDEPESGTKPISIYDPQPVRDTRKDFSPMRKMEEIETNWEDIWARNVEGRRTKGWF